MNEKVKISCVVDPADDSEKDHIRIEMTGSTAGLLAAYEQLSVHLFKTLEESMEPEFAEFAYTLVRMKIIEGVPALKKDFEKTKKTVEKVRPLMNILGKTFHVGGDE